MTNFLDTNVIIDLLNGNSKVLVSFKNAYVFNSVKIPDLVYYEVLRGFEYSDPKKLKGLFENFALKRIATIAALETFRVPIEIRFIF